MLNNRTFVLSFVLIIMVTMAFLMTGCGENKQIVGEWHMAKVLVGEQEFEAADFLDPTGNTDGTFIIKFYGDQTLIATGSLGTIKGASDGTWKKNEDNIYQISIDNQNREVKLVGDLLLMEIEIKDATIVVVFERQ